jgi:hypothetical protein
VTPPPTVQTLDDLRRVIRRLETTRPARPAPEPVERILGGELVETDEGAVVVVRHEYALVHRHGIHPLDGAFAAPASILGLICPALREAGPGSAGAAAVDPRRFVFLDAETTGLAGGTGTYAFLVGVGHLEGDRFVVLQYFMRDFDDEPALLTALAPLLTEAAAVVTFNGAGFDLPLLETRFVLGRRRWPPTLVNVDLLRPSRRMWSACLADCRLATLERALLGLAREEDVPGAVIPMLYFEFLRSRRALPLARVLTHNRLDVLSLVTLLGWFAHALSHPGGLHLHAEALAGAGRLWETEDVERALACYRDALAGGLAGRFAHWVRLRLAQWEKRGARWESACELWETATRHAAFDPRPWEELAKFHEHRRRDLATARTIVLDALALARTSGASASVLDAFAHRLRRLERRFRFTRARGEA